MYLTSTNKDYKKGIKIYKNFEKYSLGNYFINNQISKKWQLKIILNGWMGINNYALIGIATIFL